MNIDCSILYLLTCAHPGEVITFRAYVLHLNAHVSTFNRNWLLTDKEESCEHKLFCSFTKKNSKIFKFVQLKSLIEFLDYDCNLYNI